MQQLSRTANRPWGLIVAGAASCAISFFVTLWLTQPQETNFPASIGERIDRLQSSTVPNQPALSAAANAAGLFLSPALRGHIDGVARQPDGKVNVSGWVAKIGGDGSPLTLVGFVGGRGAVVGRTNGARDDVTRAPGLSQSAAKNVKIEAVLICQPRGVFILVAIDSDGSYFSLDPGTCP